MSRERARKGNETKETPPKAPPASKLKPRLIGRIHNDHQFNGATLVDVLTEGVEIGGEIPVTVV